MLLFRRLRWRLLVLGLSLLATAAGLYAPYAQQKFTEALIAERPAQGWILAAFACLVAYQALWQLNTWLSTRESLIAQKSLGDSSFHRLLEGPGGLVGRAPAGVAVSLFAVDVPGAGALLDQSFLMGSSLLFPLLLAPLALHSLFGIPWWAGGGSIAALALVNYLLARRQSRFFMAFKSLAAERTGLVSEWVQNIRTLRILGWVGAAERKIFALRRRETANRKKMVTNGQIMNSIASSATFSLNVLAILLLLRIRAAAGGSAEPTPGELLSLLWILGVFLSRPLRQLPWMLVMTFDALSSARRLESALAIPVLRPGLREPHGAEPVRESPGPFALEVQGLSLEVDGKLLLRDIHLKLRKGALVAVVGEVGSGKSVLLHSLIGGTGARFDGVNLNGRATGGPLDPGVRGRIAFVPQEGFTNSATLRENVLFTYLDGAPPAPGADERVNASFAACQFQPANERVPHGLDSEIGERGVNLSGGQRQRISLARAHYAEREIILLDDCLSAVDVDTERKLIGQLIRGDWKDHTRLIATHRLSILPYCDEVLFLREGQVELRGTHQELTAASVAYREFVRREDEKPSAGGPAP
jgi:ABC-type multidrug transport system fused ATPase/permease subunit